MFHCTCTSSSAYSRSVQRLPQLGNRGAYLIQKMNDKLVEHRQYIKDNGVDLPEVRAWKWNDGKGVEV